MACSASPFDPAGTRPRLPTSQSTIWVGRVAGPIGTLFPSTRIAESFPSNASRKSLVPSGNPTLAVSAATCTPIRLALEIGPKMPKRQPRTSLSIAPPPRIRTAAFANPSNSRFSIAFRGPRLVKALVTLLPPESRTFGTAATFGPPSIERSPSVRSGSGATR